MSEWAISSISVPPVTRIQNERLDVRSDVDGAVDVRLDVVVERIVELGSPCGVDQAHRFGRSEEIRLEDAVRKAEGGAVECVLGKPEVGRAEPRGCPPVGIGGEVQRSVLRPFRGSRSS